MRTMTRDDLVAASRVERESDAVEFAAVDLPLLCTVVIEHDGGYTIWEGARVVLIGGQWTGHATCQDERHAALTVAAAVQYAAELDGLRGREATWKTES